ncbi:NAD(P)H-binding protein [Lactococcus fujiensis]|nr:NAD(P)H-binding protein [Lactococcus fujiensis]
MKILIVGAAGKIGRDLTQRILENTSWQLALLARNADGRIDLVSDRIQLISGDAYDPFICHVAAEGVDAVVITCQNGVILSYFLEQNVPLIAILACDVQRHEGFLQFKSAAACFDLLLENERVKYGKE